MAQDPKKKDDKKAAKPAADRAAKNAAAVEDPRDESPGAKQARQHVGELKLKFQHAVPRVDELLKGADASPLSAGPDKLEECAEVLEKLAATLRVKGALLKHGTGKANPMLQVTVENVRSELHAAVSEIEAAPHLPKSWEKAESRVSSGLKAMKAAGTLLGQEGMSAASHEQGEPLRGDDGEKLVK